MPAQSGHTVTAAESVIVVIDDSPDHSDKLKELLEFMDVPNVCTSTPSDWRAQIGDQRLAAVFVCDHLGKDAVAHVIDGVAEVDRNVPIVFVGGQSHA